LGGSAAVQRHGRPRFDEEVQMTLTRRPPQMADLEMFREAVDRLFDERPFRPIWLGNGDGETTAALDLYTTPEAVIAKIALPGIKPEDIDVSIADDVVTVRGSFTDEKESETGYIRKELTRGSRTRSFALPVAVRSEAATASFKDGLLTLTMPKTEEVKPRHVKVEVTD
jgi:HSP20 family protein